MAKSEAKVEAKKAPAAAVPATGELKLCVESKVQEYLKGCELRCSGDVAGKLNAIIAGVLDKAAQRAKDNDRQTVGARDL